MYNVFPNPTNGSFSLKIAGPKYGSFEYELTDIAGKIILREEFYKSTEINTQEIDVLDQPGIYFLKVHNGDMIKTIKIIKQ